METRIYVLVKITKQYLKVINDGNFTKIKNIIVGLIYFRKCSVILSVMCHKTTK